MTGLLLALAVAAAVAPEDAPAGARALLAEYETAFAAKDLDRLGRLYHPEATIYEGGTIDRGWVSYRDHHLGPELREMEAPRLSHTDVTVRALGPDAAYVAAEYRLVGRIKGRDLDAGGLETLILVREGGAWRIRHSHISSKRRPGSAASPAPSPHP